MQPPKIHAVADLFWVHVEPNTGRPIVYVRNWGHETERGAIRAWREATRHHADWHEEQAAKLRKRAAGVVWKGYPR